MTWVPYNTSPAHQEIVAQLGLEQRNETLIADYFVSLASEIRDRPLVEGKIVIGMGTGRCGSLSLTQIIASIPNACVTHENPIWCGTVVEFHKRRFDMLKQRFSVVFNINPNCITYASQIPGAKIIALRRDLLETVASFQKIGWSIKKDQLAPFYVQLERLHTMVDKVLTVNTLALNQPETQQKIFDFIGEPGVYRPVHANRNGTLEQRPWF